MLQHVFSAVRVPEGDVPKFDFAQQRLPIFPLGMEYIAVLLCDLRRVPDLWLLIQKPGNPFNRGLQGDEFRNVGGRHLNGLKDAHSIGGKRGKRRNC